MIHVNMTTGDLEAILAAAPNSREGMGRVVGTRFPEQAPSKELIHRVHRVPNYIAALKSILIELSKQCKRKFPPPDYKSPCSYESLRCKAS